MKKVFFLSAAIVLLLICSTANAEKYGMYVKVAESVEGTFDEVVKKTKDALTNNNWKIITSYEAGVPEGCTFRAYNIVVNSNGYTQKIMSQKNRASFALPQRVGIYEDEKGINIAFVNPASLNRTVLGDNVESELSVSTMNSLSDIIAAALKGNIVKQQIGQIRKKGRVGGMGGGDFNKKVEVVFEKEDAENVLKDISEKVKEGILADKKGWELVYTLDLSDHNTVIYGVNNKKMEAKAFKIAGEKRDSKSNPCPGIDHVAAFPIQVIIYKEDEMIKVVLLDEMYRMKLYFEDAGMWAFMKNMKMPGDIEKEIVSMIFNPLYLGKWKTNEK